jgi:delta24-sterol reductase
MGYQLAIQVEMEDLTIGGLCMGLGMETNSHTLGLIQETVVAFEIVLANGDFMRVTKDSNPELFYALPWSHGAPPQSPPLRHSGPGPPHTHPPATPLHALA